MKTRGIPFHVFWLRGQGVVDILKTNILSENRKKWANFGDHSRMLVINAMVIFSRNRVKNQEHTWVDLQLVFHQAKQTKERYPQKSKDVFQSDLKIKRQTTDFHPHRRWEGMAPGREERQIKKRLDKRWKEVLWQRYCRKSLRGRESGHMKNDSPEKEQLLERRGVRRPF